MGFSVGAVEQKQQRHLVHACGDAYAVRFLRPALHRVVFKVSDLHSLLSV
eukprot:CAMPEP_0185845850 /NCGR_PEP_ID=MMETSP1354-20130828/1708_1 /TAXON_ID=708628 /ORGANISM="Erythrolobus madagascarensis, Strain CCMP3276" /LENGTH=49 /DNA_ID=CAMNT_0028545913 /DNA_START=466 /DNA_END=615 /DNA_ORIENTATION=-